MPEPMTLDLGFIRHIAVERWALPTFQLQAVLLVQQFWQKQERRIIYASLLIN